MDKKTAGLPVASKLRNEKAPTQKSGEIIPGSVPIVPTPWVSNDYLKASVSRNTQKAYNSDVHHFQKWGGYLPTCPEVIVNYLQSFANSLNPRTLSRHLTALKCWHEHHGFAEPTSHPIVRKTLAGIGHVHGKTRKKAPALLPEHLLQIVNHLNQDQSMATIRDNALLQLAFFGAFRRSELIAICHEHITWQEQGIEILVPHSKTDQMHDGRLCAVPFGNELLCPSRALKAWLDISRITNGAIFRRIDRWGNMAKHALAPLAVNDILRRRALEANIEHAEKLSSHSLRRGLATSASRDGASLPAIMRQGRWQHVNTVLEYIEAAQQFEENAAGQVLSNITATQD